MENVKKKNRIFNMVIYVVSALLIIFAVVLLARERVFTPKAPYQSPGPVRGGSDGATPEPLSPLGTPVQHYDRIPVRFNFDAKEVSCDIYPVGIDENNVMDAKDSADEVSWLSVAPYVAPGEVGNAILGGHNLWKGKAGSFSLLKKLQVGEGVSVTFDDGYSEYFKVVRIYECSHDSNEPMEVEGITVPRLTLITCKGDWSSDLGMSLTRVIAVCEPINP